MPPSFAHRVYQEEMMDNYAITDERLTRALHDLQRVNRWLGGYQATIATLAPHLRPGRPLRVLDLGTGLADFPAYLLHWAASRGYAIEVVGVDANPATVAYAQNVLDRQLPPHLRPHVRLVTGDALDLPYPADAFDVAVASLFMHHLGPTEAVSLLTHMQRVSRKGLIVNDLHRHPLAYYGIKCLATLFSSSVMFKHDAPLSVRRGFTRDELLDLARAAHLPRPMVRWHWAFRWTLSTL